LTESFGTLKTHICFVLRKGELSKGLYTVPDVKHTQTTRNEEYLMRTLTVTVLLAATLLLVGCATQETIVERTEILGERPAESNFQEAQQIAAAEDWKDLPGKIVNLYLINPVTGGLLVPPVQCLGVPNSSTESLEPNHGSPRGALSGSYWLVPIDGVDVLTDELAGKDGTFGEPVAFRYCMSVDGHYYDFPSLGVPYLISSASYTFAEATVNRDYETEAKLLIAEDILNRGGCINVETLQEIPCE
jgi:hypothetical protein